MGWEINHKKITEGPPQNLSFETASSISKTSLLFLLLRYMLYQNE
jgi:hypothetical protein